MKFPLLECKNISKSFYKNGVGRLILNNINFSVNEGDVLLIRGKSGAGKSVLLSLLSGLDRPTTGEIYFENYKLNSSSIKELTALRETKIGVIFQNFNLISYWNSVENVEAGIGSNGSSSREKKKAAEYYLEVLGLEKSKYNYPDELSMGEQQRVAVARTLIKQPKLIIADEPTGEVDIETSELIFNNMFERNKATNTTTFIIASHGHFPENKANRILELRNGAID